MITFRIVPHTVRPHTEVVEVWRNGVFVAQVTPNDHGGVRVLSKYMGPVQRVDRAMVNVDLNSREHQ